MNQRHLWTIVALFLTIMGIPLVGNTQTTTKGNAPSSQKPAVSDVVKVGEFQSLAVKLASDAVITNIHPHNVEGRQAATLFIRNIPVLTFLSSKQVASIDTKVGVIGEVKGVQSHALIAGNSTKAASIANLTTAKNQTNSITDDPVQKASLIAAKINQMVRDNIAADKITVSWQGESTTATQAQNKSANQQQPSDRYIIKIAQQELVEIDENTQLANSTKNPAQDALQATNRLRRLIGNASPLREIANLPVRPAISIQRLPQRIATATGVRLNFRGMASYYGYDGSGTKTASGERFHPEGMTAAHRSLPFGTKVRVTNSRNGRSVVLRITDRGPYIRGRIIDVSAGAARILGMMGSGIAPVHIEVLGRE